MTNNNYERFDIMLSINNPYNYMEFVAVCNSKNIEPLSFSEYAQKVELIFSAMKKYPDLVPKEAYEQLLKEQHNIVLSAVEIDASLSGLNAHKPADKPCGTCGGGVLR